MTGADSSTFVFLIGLTVLSCAGGNTPTAHVDPPVLATNSANTAIPTPSANHPPPNPPPPADEPLPARREGMILVPAGPFIMGADSGGEPDEWPAHSVTLPAFYLDENEVTNEDWGRCVAANECPPPEPANAERNGLGPDKRFRGPKQPVSSISWFSARAYCAFVGKRLPTEAEFEKASRGPEGRLYPWGSNPPGPHRAVFGQSITADVGTHPDGDGPYGHHDLAGNVWEWMEDVYDPIAYRRPGAATGQSVSCAIAEETYADLRKRNQQGFTGSNPIPTECENVLRGGGFNYHALGLRSTNRVHHPPRFRMVMSGLRCARDAKRQPMETPDPGMHGPEPG
ncbi:MAG TPA: SUMF1/EgtB/PvdO family nonheme iron enzyme [Polyangium sp.]|nr:SUMF1/EgtB/PvdO family nonheme iron enzyme [Polyangium sp.]